MDDFTEVSTQGWFSRIGDSIKGILFGLLLFIIAFPVLWWNEGRSVERYKTLVEGASLVVPINADQRSADNEGKLVHLSGLATTQDLLQDPVFHVSAQAIKLVRSVSTYQWKETVKSTTEKQTGGSTKTTKTYHYEKVWNSGWINSSAFKHRSGHENPSSLRFQSETFQAKKVTIGAFHLSAGQIGRISGSRAVDLSQKQLPQLPGQPVTLIDNQFYLGQNPSQPAVGDTKISFKEVPPTEISLIARQVQSSFTPYQTKTGGTVDLLVSGTQSAEAMFSSAQQANTMLTWGLRLLGVGLMWFGLSLIFKPLSVVADVLPFIGNLVSMGTGLVALLIALPFSLVTIAIAWIVYRPLLAGILIAVSVVALFASKNLSKRATNRQAAHA